MERVDASTSLGRLLRGAPRGRRPISMRRRTGGLLRVDGKLFASLRRISSSSTDDIHAMLREAFSASISDRIENAEMDLSFLCGKVIMARISTSSRALNSSRFGWCPQRIPDLSELEHSHPKFPELAKNTARIAADCTGASGQGKSTTACALLQCLNETMALRVITIEDPIEYLFVGPPDSASRKSASIPDPSPAEFAIPCSRTQRLVFIGGFRNQESIRAAVHEFEPGVWSWPRFMRIQLRRPLIEFGILRGRRSKQRQRAPGQKHPATLAT